MSDLILPSLGPMMVPDPAETSQLSRINDLEAIHAKGYVFGGYLLFTADGTFTKATYPGLQAIIAECQGGGGAAGGAVATGAATISAGCGGGGGGYARSLIVVANLDASEAVTVGAGGTGVSGAAGNAGDDSIFDTISGEVRGVGGGGGSAGSATGALTVLPAGGVGGAGTGDLVVPGDDGGRAIYLGTGTTHRGAGHGGSSFLGGSRDANNAENSTGVAGQRYGGGGAGAHNSESQSARTGGAGAIGIVIVTLLY